MFPSDRSFYFSAVLGTEARIFFGSGLQYVRFASQPSIICLPSVTASEIPLPEEQNQTGQKKFE